MHISGAMNKAQEIDYAYHAERLLLLIARKEKLLANSDQVRALDIEIMSIADLVRSYRLVREHELPRRSYVSAVEKLSTRASMSVRKF